MLALSNLQIREQGAVDNVLGACDLATNQTHLADLDAAELAQTYKYPRCATTLWRELESVRGEILHPEPTFALLSPRAGTFAFQTMMYFILQERKNCIHSSFRTKYI